MERNFRGALERKYVTRIESASTFPTIKQFGRSTDNFGHVSRTHKPLLAASKRGLPEHMPENESNPRRNTACVEDSSGVKQPSKGQKSKERLKSEEPLQLADRGGHPPVKREVKFSESEVKEEGVSEGDRAFGEEVYKSVPQISCEEWPRANRGGGMRKECVRFVEFSFAFLDNPQISKRNTIAVKSKAAAEIPRSENEFSFGGIKKTVSASASRFTSSEKTLRHSHKEMESHNQRAVNEEEEPKAEKKPLSTSTLQKLISENILSHSPRLADISSNHKSQQLADYVRTLRTHMGTADSPEHDCGSPDFSHTPFMHTPYLRISTQRDKGGNSPDFTNTPFINVGKEAITERYEATEVFNLQAEHQSSLAALRNQLSGIPTSINFPQEVDDSKIQRLKARLLPATVGNAAGVMVTDKPDRFEKLRKCRKVSD